MERLPRTMNTRESERRRSCLTGRYYPAIRHDKVRKTSKNFVRISGTYWIQVYATPTIH